MSTAEMTSDMKLLLRAFQVLEQQRQAPTVQGACLLARMTYMQAYDLVNELFAAGYLSHDLKVTEAGRRAAK